MDTPDKLVCISAEGRALSATLVYTFYCYQEQASQQRVAALEKELREAREELQQLVR